MSTNTFFTKTVKFFENVGYARASIELQRMSDDQLDSLGLSRRRLQLGAAGIPWNGAELEVTHVATSADIISHPSLNTQYPPAQNDTETVRLAA